MDGSCGRISIFLVCGKKSNLFGESHVLDDPAIYSAICDGGESLHDERYKLCAYPLDDLDIITQHDRRRRLGLRLLRVRFIACAGR